MLLDALQRPLANLRLQATGRCNLRCQYCMPEQDYGWLPREDILHFEEIDRIDPFLDFGVRKVRLTGAEPLLRPVVPVLVEHLARKPRIEDVAMTTNGVLLAAMAASLKGAGLHRLTVSLDTLHRNRFLQLTRSDELARVPASIDTAAPLFPGLTTLSSFAVSTMMNWWRWSSSRRAATPKSGSSSTRTWAGMCGEANRPRSRSPLGDARSFGDDSAELVERDPHVELHSRGG
jgi:hypothetical protein